MSASDDENREITNLGQLIADLTEYAGQLPEGAQTEVRMAVCDGSGMQFTDRRDLSYWTFVPREGAGPGSTFVLLRGHAHLGELPGQYSPGVASEADTELQSLTGTDAGSTGPAEGIWLSTYEYQSDGRDGALTSRHHVAVTNHGGIVRVESLPASRSQVRMQLQVDGRTALGQWMERTDPDGHYAGAVYAGTVALIVGLDGQSMTGAWAGADRNDAAVNTGPWTLTLLEPSAGEEARGRWNRQPG